MDNLFLFHPPEVRVIARFDQPPNDGDFSDNASSSAQGGDTRDRIEPTLGDSDSDGSMPSASPLSMLEDPDCK